MTKSKRKPRKAIRPNSQTQNPKMILEEVEGEELQVENPKVMGEEAFQIQTLETIEEEEEAEQEQLQIQNPKMIEVEEELPIRNPRIVEVEEELVIQNPNSIPEDLQTQSHNLIEEEEQQEVEEQEGMIPSHSTLFNLPDPEISTPTITNFSRKVSKKKKAMNPRQRAALEKKIQLIKKNLKPIPFVPSKTLDFSKHEKLFRRLGLWDFVHLEFDREIRSDLLTLLIANYNSSLRYSTVNDCRIMVNRADLARALKLPVKKDKNVAVESLDLDSDVLNEESIAFIGEFVSNWILLHEDMWMMPNEVLTWTRFVKERQPHKVDWPGLIWFMVEKELSQAPQIGPCYYASHLQYLMKSQRADLFKEECTSEVPMEEGEETIDLKMGSLEDFERQESEKQKTELSVGHDKNESEQKVSDDTDEGVMDFHDCKEELGDPAEWLLDGKNNIDDHCLKRCNLNEVEDLEGRCIKEDKEEIERYGLSSKCTTIERLASTDLLQAMETSIPYSLPMDLHDHSPGEFLQSRADTHMNLGGPSMFGNACKRELSEEDATLHSFNDHPKRMRNDGAWDHKSMDFDLCLEQINSWVGKARMMYAMKDQACNNAHVNQEFLMSELQQRDANLHKSRCEVQKKESEIYKLEHELHVMSNLLEGYRKALKETRRAFSEYRECFPHPEEPLYRDVGGPGGIVLSTMELEKQLLEQEEEEKVQRCMVEQKIKDFQATWFGRLQVYLNDVILLSKRLLEFGEEFKLLKEIRFAKIKRSET